MNTQKYIDMINRNPRGVVVMAILKYHWPEWINLCNKYKDHGHNMSPGQVADEDLPWVVATDAIWGFGVLNWSAKDARKAAARYPSRAQSDIIFQFDNWLETLLYRQAGSASTKYIAKKYPKEN